VAGLGIAGIDFSHLIWDVERLDWRFMGEDDVRIREGKRVCVRVGGLGREKKKRSKTAKFNKELLINNVVF
jgi:hypothetical protein